MTTQKYISLLKDSCCYFYFIYKRPTKLLKIKPVCHWVIYKKILQDENCLHLQFLLN